MSRNFVSPEELTDLKKFEGRVLTLLGDILSLNMNMYEDIQNHFFLPKQNSEQDLDISYDGDDEDDSDGDESE